jgi:hypothetical protein
MNILVLRLIFYILRVSISTTKIIYLRRVCPQLILKNRFGCLLDGHLCAFPGMPAKTVVLSERSEFTTVPAYPENQGACGRQEGS